jgi:outer membrane protein assembly factor BamA
MLNRKWTAILICIPLSGMLWASCPKKQDHRDDKNSGVLITDFVITGTQSLSTRELADIESKMTDSCFNEDSEELGERIRALFQDRGYFTVEVKSVRIKPTDVLGVPKPITLEADVAEGQRYKLAQVKVVENHAFSAEKLRSQFPMKPGQLFERSKVAAGLESLRKLYVQDGFLDFAVIPGTEVSSNATVLLTLTVEEGQQYHMGQLHILAKKETAEKLRGDWQLQEGAVFDFGYIDRYVDANREKLPDGFNREDVQLVRDCPKASVDVRLLVDPIYVAQQPQPKDITCEKKSSSN